jgi:hypothetical protein
MCAAIAFGVGSSLRALAKLGDRAIYAPHVLQPRWVGWAAGSKGNQTAVSVKDGGCLPKTSQLAPLPFYAAYGSPFVIPNESQVPVRAQELPYLPGFLWVQ